MKHKLLFPIIAALLLVVGFTSIARAEIENQYSPDAAITVNTTMDEYNTNPSNCSLREAIQAANKDIAFGGCTTGSGDDVITLPAGTYPLTIPGTGGGLNADGDLVIGTNITINGAGQTTTIIDGNQLDRILDIQSGTVVLNDLTITNGHAPDGEDGEPGSTPGDDGSDGTDGQNGGGIRNAGDLTLNKVTISNNQAGDGGAGA